MKKFNFKEIISYLQEYYREFDIADSISVYFAYNHLPIKINGDIKPELKILKGSFCINKSYEKDKSVDDYKEDIKLLIFEEYSDSLHSIYIFSDGKVDANPYCTISSIEIGKQLSLKLEGGKVTHYDIKEGVEDALKQYL